MEDKCLRTDPRRTDDVEKKLSSVKSQFKCEDLKLFCKISATKQKIFGL